MSRARRQARRPDDRRKLAIRVDLHDVFREQPALRSSILISHAMADRRRRAERVRNVGNQRPTERDVRDLDSAANAQRRQRLLAGCLQGVDLEHIAFGFRLGNKPRRRRMICGGIDVAAAREQEPVGFVQDRPRGIAGLDAHGLSARLTQGVKILRRRVSTRRRDNDARQRTKISIV